MNKNIVSLLVYGFFNVCAWFILLRPYDARHPEPFWQYVSIPAILVIMGFIAGLGFSIAVLIVQYFKRHWKT